MAMATVFQARHKAKTIRIRVNLMGHLVALHSVRRHPREEDHRRITHSSRTFIRSLRRPTATVEVFGMPACIRLLVAMRFRSAFRITTSTTETAARQVYSPQRQAPSTLLRILPSNQYHHFGLMRCEAVGKRLSREEASESLAFLHHQRENTRLVKTCLCDKQVWASEASRH